MADAPAHQRGGVPKGSGATPTSPPPVTGELLFYHVTGHWPRPGTLGLTEADLPPAANFIAEVSASGERDDDGRSTKKRRKVGARRGKLSEIWFDEAEYAFCTSVACIPPNGRTKIKFFGRPLGRNELIAAICTLATHKLYNRKQISSHSQVLKDKVPSQYKEIFTFEDKSRGGDDTGESATANVIENYRFPEAIYRLLGYAVGEDLANMQKPQWLLDLEAGDHANAPEATSAVGGFWSTTGEPYEYYGQGRPSDRDARGHMAPSSYESSYYQQPLRHRDIPSFPTSLPPPLRMDPQSPVTSTATSSESVMGRRYPYGPHGAGAATGAYASRLPGSLWEGGDHSHSPTNSQFDGQSQSSGVSPRQIPGPGSSWSEAKPTLSSSGDHLTLPQLQEPSAQWNAIPRGNLQPLILPSISGPATSPTYGLSSSSWMSPTGGPAVGYRTQLWNGDAREASQTTSMFIPDAIELSLRTPTGAIALSPLPPSDVVATDAPIGLGSIPLCQIRYPFLYDIDPASNQPVFHIEVPLFLGPERSERRVLVQSSGDIELRLSLRSLSNPSAWSVTTDSSYNNYVPGSSPSTFGRMTAPLRQQQSPSGEFVTSVMLQQLGHLFQSFAANAALDGQFDSLLALALPYSAVVQRIVRDSHTYSSASRFANIAADYSEAACLIVYSFVVATGPTARPVCRQVDLDIRSSPVRTSEAVEELIQGETADPSDFGWMRSSG